MQLATKKGSSSNNLGSKYEAVRAQLSQVPRVVLTKHTLNEAGVNGHLELNIPAPNQLGQDQDLSLCCQDLADGSGAFANGPRHGAATDRIRTRQAPSDEIASSRNLSSLLLIEPQASRALKTIDQRRGWGSGASWACLRHKLGWDRRLKVQHGGGSGRCSLCLFARQPSS